MSLDVRGDDAGRAVRADLGLGPPGSAGALACPEGGGGGGQGGAGRGGPPDPTTLSRPYRFGLFAGIAIIGAVALWHIGAIFLVNAPRNIISHRLQGPVYDWVSPELDLVEVALRIAHDDKEHVARWMNDVKLAKV